MNIYTHEVHRLAAQMVEEGASNEEIERAINEYLMACDLEHPEVQAALFAEIDHNPTLIEYAQMPGKERNRCHAVWSNRRRMEGIR